MPERTARSAAPVRLTAAIAVLAVSAGCATTDGPGHHQAASPGRHGGLLSAAPRGTPAGLPGISGQAGQPAALSPPAPAPGAAVVRQVLLSDGVLMSVARFTGSVRYMLHAGSADPGGLGLAAGPAIGAAARRELIAAFNGGFRLSAGAGGYEQEGRIISPLVPGLASLVIYSSGAASIGAWGRGVPRRGSQVVSVRQNLGLLVAGGHPMPAAADWPVWGATITGGEYVARSAVGQNAAGQLIYVASMFASPADLAAALVRFGARVGMELDINPEWVQLAYAHTPGGPLIAGVIGQARPANQYLIGWTRDFFAVLAMAQPSPPQAPGLRLRILR